MNRNLFTLILTWGYMHLFAQDINLTRYLGSDFIPVLNCSSDYADVDKDGDFDLVLTGKNESFDPELFTKLYLNDGSGNFSEVADISLPEMVKGEVKFGDFNGDAIPDLLCLSSTAAAIYLNNGFGQFSQIWDLGPSGLGTPAVSVGDIVGDSDLDIVATGYNLSDKTFVIFNNQDGSFTIPDACIGVGNGDLELADLDGDQDLDYVISGEENNTPISKVF